MMRGPAGKGRRMTWALCFNCGATKFGASCPCPECQRASTGDMGLDIAFSDHHWSEATLKAFGEVVRSLRRVGEGRVPAGLDGPRALGAAPFVPQLALDEVDELGAHLDAALAEGPDDLLRRSLGVPLQDLADEGGLVNPARAVLALGHK